MLPFAHLAGAYLAGRLWNRLVPKCRMNSLIVMLGGIVPDLIDKPIALLPEWESSRSIGHTILFCVALYFLGKGYPFCRALALGALTHLILDNPPTYLEVLFWPLLGPEFDHPDNLRLDLLLQYLKDPLFSLPEVVGALVVGFVAVRHALIAFGVIPDRTRPKEPTRQESFVAEIRRRREEAAREPPAAPETTTAPASPPAGESQAAPEE